jgi:hypothetical protein
VLGRYLRKGEKDETLDVGRILDIASSPSKLSSTDEVDCRSTWGNVASVGVLLRANGRSQSAISGIRLYFWQSRGLQNQNVMMGICSWFVIDGDEASTFTAEMERTTEHSHRCSP